MKTVLPGGIGQTIIVNKSNPFLVLPNVNFSVIESSP